MAVQEHTGWERKNSMNKIAILDAATQSVQYQDDDGTKREISNANYSLERNMDVDLR